MQAKKTHEQQMRTLERKPDIPDVRRTDVASEPVDEAPTLNRPQARASEFAVSRGGAHQESRDHNKHNDSGQSGHKPQRHGPAEEKH